MALAPDGAVVTAGISDAPDGRQPVITLTGASAAAQRVDIAKIPGAVEPQVAVNSVAAQGSTQVAVGSANGFPAAWTSEMAAASGPGPPAPARRCSAGRVAAADQRYARPLGWLAVGGVTAAAPEHPVVVVSADGTSWQAADGEGVFGAPGCSPSRRRPTARATSSSATRTQAVRTAGSSDPHRGRGLVVGHPGRLAARRGRHRGRARRDR